MEGDKRKDGGIKIADDLLIAFVEVVAEGVRGRCWLFVGVGRLIEAAQEFSEGKSPCLTVKFNARQVDDVYRWYKIGKDERDDALVEGEGITDFAADEAVV